MPRKRSFGQPRRSFDSIDTTMREAAEWAAEGAPEGALVTAAEQTKGRGRLGRGWTSQAGVGLYFSLIVRPKVTPAQSTVLTLACGLGVARGIGEACGLHCDIRWPNDILIADKKCCGILVEMDADGDQVGSVIIGVGVNVNQPSLPEELRDIATSLRIATGCEYVLDVVLQSILAQLERYYDMFLERGAPAVIKSFERASSYVRHKRVVVTAMPGEIEGVTAGLDSSGVLLLLTDDGEIRPILAGSVRPV